MSETTKSEEWLSAAAALALLKGSMSPSEAAQTICDRANAGLIRSRAERFIRGDQVTGGIDVPKAFWWARGHEGLTQNWITGDFETWIDRKVHLRAYGVTFSKEDVQKLIPDKTGPLHSPDNRGGRPRADWWDDLWIEICRQLYNGDLKPKTQADIERAMHQWISDHDGSAGETTIRQRARKLWRALVRDEN